MLTRDKLDSTLGELGIASSEALYDALMMAYGEAGRSYHNGKHIAECLTQLSRYQSSAERPEEIALALWFHDAIYDPRSNDNEEKSAAWAVAFLDQAEAPAALSERIHRMIIATKTHLAADADTALLVDIDLGILGTTAETFERYDRAIREEYSWVPEADYRIGRAGVLQGFLDRDAIYRTPEIRNAYERQARINLRRKISELST